MFGHQDDTKPVNDSVVPDKTIDNVINQTTAPTVNNGQSPDWQHPGAPINAEESTTELETTSETTLETKPKVITPPSSSITPTQRPMPSPLPSAGDLADIKQHALSQLTPLVGHLDQSPEDKFRTTMMMIQASDDQSLVQTAYEAAQKIEDDKARAQALLDVVNEINYFTQHSAEDSQPSQK